MLTMNNRFFTKILLVLTIGSIFIVWTFNYVVDPYGENYQFIFSGNTEKHVRDERISKFALIENNPMAKNFIFGSSRSLALDPVKLGEYTHTEALNLGFSSSSSAEYYLYIKYLIETREVSNIVLGIDLLSYTENFESNGVMPPELFSYFNMDNERSLKKYVSFKMFRRSWETLSKNYSNNVPVSRYTEKGQIIKKDYLAIRDDKERLQQYVEKNVVNDAPRWGSKSSALSDELLSNLSMIKDLCLKNKVNLHLFMSPIYINQITMKNNRFGQQKKLLKYIATNISPIHDFNGITDINIDPVSFLDSFHYSYDIANIILKDIFVTNDSTYTRKGFFVTKDNVDDYIDTVDERLNEYINNSK